MAVNRSESERTAFILQNTRLVPPFLCPEMRLHLITELCPLWHATEPELAVLGIGDPYWGFCWAGGQALARYILDHGDEFSGKRVLDFGAGCGVEAVAAMMSGARSVLAADIDPFAATATQLNARANGVSVETTTEDLIGRELSGFDAVIAGDMFYDPAFARKVLSWFSSLGSAGMEVFLGDPSRGNLPPAAALSPLAVYQATADTDLAGKHLQRTTVYALKSR